MSPPSLDRVGDILVNLCLLSVSAFVRGFPSSFYRAGGGRLSLHETLSRKQASNAPICTRNDLMAIDTFGPLVKNKALHIVTDNISTMANINHKGGQSLLLTLFTKAIDTTSISYQPVSVFPVFCSQKTVTLIVNAYPADDYYCHFQPVLLVDRITNIGNKMCV